MAPLIIALGWLGCESASPARQADVQPPEQAPTQGAPDAEVAPEVFRGDGPVTFTDPVVLLEADGLVVDTQRWRTETSSGRAWRARAATIEVTARDDLGMLDALEPEGSPPWAMVNGGFYESDPEGAYRPMGVVVSHGESRSPFRHRGGSGVLSVDAEGTASLVHRPDWKQASKTRPRHALQSIDRIVVDGASVVTQGKDARGAARTAVALEAGATWLVIAAADASIREAGPSSWRLSGTSRGMTLWEWSRFVLESTGAPHALNLDGGVSTQLRARSQSGRVEVSGERGTLNAVVVRP